MVIRSPYYITVIQDHMSPQVALGKQDYAIIII